MGQQVWSTVRGGDKSCNPFGTAAITAEDQTESAIFPQVEELPSKNCTAQQRLHGMFSPRLNRAFFFLSVFYFFPKSNCLYKAAAATTADTTHNLCSRGARSLSPVTTVSGACTTTLLRTSATTERSFHPFFPSASSEIAHVHDSPVITQSQEISGHVHSHVRTHACVQMHMCKHKHTHAHTHTHTYYAGLVSAL